VVAVGLAADRLGGGGSELAGALGVGVALVVVVVLLGGLAGSRGGGGGLGGRFGGAGALAVPVVTVGLAADGFGGRGGEALGEDGLEHAEENESRGELHGDGGGGIVVEWVSKVGNRSFLFFFWLNECLGDNERMRCADGSGREE
jgi:hypothetical protein